jgi:hypothetical protein
MEVEFHSFNLERRGGFYFQSFLFFLLALGFSLWGNVIVFADPSTKVFATEDSRTPISKRVLDPSKNWRTPKKSKYHWREPEEHKSKDQKGRIKKKSSSLYGSNNEGDNWDPYSFRSKQGTHTQPATLFKLRF